MTPAEALADLAEISSQVEAAVLLDAGGTVLAATLPPEAAGDLARAAGELLDGAGRIRSGVNVQGVTHVEVATRDGSLFVVRADDRLIAATTGPAPTVGLVLYDLKTCLRALAEDGGPDPAA